MTALAQEMGWPITDQSVYNLIALMRVSGGSDGYFDTGDIVSGALAMGYEIDGPEALNALADFRTIFANGTTGNEASMKAAHAENTELLKQLAGGQPLNEMFAKTDSKEATDLFHATVRSLATAISTGDTAAWEEAYPWLQKFDLQYLNFDWDHLGLKDPTPGRQPASGPQDTEAKPMASAQGLSGTAL
ncbi:hypothetical protein [Limnobacter sp.]|uniref:hypothetical protein n=1 Tax=Limnobacter sp. TaxID=2003368 RepID=UPI0035160D0F